jgi:integrase
MSRKPLTQLAVEKLRPDPARVVEYPDHLYRSLRLIVQPSGSRSFAVRTRINGRTAKITLKECGLDLGKAREKTRELLAEIAKGNDPRAAKRKAAATTVGSVVQLFLNDAANHTSPKMQSERKRHLERDWQPLHHRPLAELRKAEIAARLLEIKQRGLITANRARSTLHAMVAWAVDQDLVDVNVVASVKPPLRREPTRARVLSTEERRAIWAATADISDPYHAVVRLLLLTGQRRQEVAGMLWSEIDLDKAMWSLAPSRTKNRLSHMIPMSKQVVEIIQAQPRRGDRVFGTQTWSRSKARLDRRCGVTGWTLHDLRRSLVTGMAEELGAAVAVIEAIVNHQSGTKAAVAGVYDRSQRIAERRNVLQAWADHVSGEPVHEVIGFPVAGHRKVGA